MAGEAFPASATSEGPHLLLYDGVCGLCNGLVQFVLRVDRAGIFHFASLQSSIAATRLKAFRIDPADLSTFVVITNYQTPGASALTKAPASLFVMRTLGWPWKVASAANVLPLNFLNALYDLVARNRYLIAGRREHCLLPTPATRARFLD